MDGGAGTEVIRIAAVADIHCRASSVGAFQPLFTQIGQAADVLLLAGDLTDRGLPEEAQVLGRELNAALKIPTIAVLGNHDFESAHERDIGQILTAAGVLMLDGDSCEVRGVGFAGVKGFGGGFGARMLEPWGEKTIKRFVHESVEEALKLETALARLHTTSRVVLLHYAPIRTTVVGEPLEVFPFLGSSRLEEPLTRFRVTAAFHGHAHAGTPEGEATGGVPVFNVAMPLLARSFPGEPPYRLLDVEAGPPSNGAVPVGAAPVPYQVRKDFEP